MIADGGKLS